MAKGLFSLFSRVFGRRKGLSKPGGIEDPHSLSTKLSHPFRDTSLLQQALTHRSSLKKAQHTAESNERLEFLGDAVLGLVVTEALYRRHPSEGEGNLTRVKSHVVSRERLAEESRRLGIGNHLILGAGEEQSGGRKRQSILSDAYEALLGAIYLDGGIDAVRDFVERGLLKRINQSSDYRGQKNYKSWLLEHVQAAGNRSPAYRVKAETGPDHFKQFFVEVSVRSEVLGTGTGPSKKKAEQAAARAALEKLGLM